MHIDEFSLPRDRLVYIGFCFQLMINIFRPLILAILKIFSVYFILNFCFSFFFIISNLKHFLKLSTHFIDFVSFMHANLL